SMLIDLYTKAILYEENDFINAFLSAQQIARAQYKRFLYDILWGVEILRFPLRESSRGSTIANGSILSNMNPLAIVEPQGFDARKTQNFNAPQYKSLGSVPKNLFKI